MTDSIFDTRQLDSLHKKMLNIATKEMPRESKKFMKKEGNKLKKVTKSTAKSLVGKNKNTKKASEYHSSIKSGKVYKYGGVWANRVYSSAPHAHLIEYGHRQVLNPPKQGSVAPIGDGKFAQGVRPGKGIGKEIGFVEGKHVFEQSGKQFESTFASDLEAFVDEVVVNKL